MYLLIAEMIAFAGIVFGLYSLRRHFGLALLYFFVAGNQFLQNLLAGTVYFQFLDRYPISPGSAVFFSGGLLAVLLVYIKEDIPTTRRLIYGVVLANVSLAVIAKSVQWGLGTGILSATDAAVDWFPFYTSGVFVVGAVLLFIDAFVVIVAFEFLRSRARWLGEWPRLVLALAFVLALDAFLFSLFAFRRLPELTDLLVGNLSGKLVAAGIYGSLLWTYLRLAPGQSAERPRELRDPFSIFTYRERFKRLEAVQAQLEKTHAEQMMSARIALKGAQLGLWEWNVATGETVHDRRTVEMLGFTGDTVIDRVEAWRELSHPEDRERVGQALRDHLRGKTSFYQVELRLRTGSGDWKWLMNMGQVVERDASGKPLRMSGAYLDVDERKLAEQRLERTESRYRELFENAPLMYVTTGDVDGVPYIKDCNRAFLETLGYERQEVIGHPVGDFYSEASERELLGEDGYKIALAGKSVTRERELVTKAGEVISTLLRAQPERESDASVIGARAMFVDISERKRAEEALRESEARLEEAQRIARVGDWEQDFRTGRETWSAGHYEIFGLDPASFTPDVEKFFERIHPEDRQRVRKVYGRALSGADEQSAEFRIIRSDGEVRTVVTESRSETDAEGNLLRMHGTIQDITEQKKAQEEILASREQLRKLAASIEAAREGERATIAREIHDELGQAMTGLKMDLSTLKPRLSSGDGRKRLEGMMSLIDRTIETVRDLSSRLRPPALDDLGLAEAIDWQVGEFARRSGIECSLDLSADEQNLDQAVAMNVFRILQEALTNVARHAQADNVEVSLRREDRALVLEVSDDGRGMDSEALQETDSLGLLGMRERAVGLGGMLTVGPGKDKGTQVLLSVPL